MIPSVKLVLLHGMSFSFSPCFMMLCFEDLGVLHVLLRGTTFKGFWYLGVCCLVISSGNLLVFLDSCAVEKEIL